MKSMILVKKSMLFLLNLKHEVFTKGVCVCVCVCDSTLIVN